MVITVSVMGKMQMPVDQVIEMIPMGNRLMATCGAMHMIGFMT